VFFQVDGDEDELEVGEEGLVEPVVAGGGLAVVLHAVEDAFDHVPPSPGDADGPGALFFGAPAACRWTCGICCGMASCLRFQSRFVLFGDRKSYTDTGHAPISSPDQSTQNFGRCPTVPHLWNRNLLKHDSINRTMAVFIFEGG